MTTGNSDKQDIRGLRTQNRKVARPSGEAPVREERSGDASPLDVLVDQAWPRPEPPDRPGAAGPQIIRDIVDIVRADLHKLLSLLPQGPHQELLLRFNRTRGGTYHARFSDSDHRLAPALEKAQQEGLIRRTSGGGEIVGFTTAKGSTYELKENATKRFKKIKGQQYGFSDRTVYITKEVAFRLPHLTRSGGVPELRNGELWVDFAKARARGLDYADEKVPSTDTPAKGLHPFEEMPRKEGHRNWHIGHEIIELDTGGSIAGCSDFQLTPRGRSELRRLEQQLVDRLATPSDDVPGLLVPAGQLLEKGTQVGDVLARAAQAKIASEERRLDRPLTDTERHDIYANYLETPNRETAGKIKPAVNDVL